MNIFFTGLNITFEAYKKAVSLKDTLKKTFPASENFQDFFYCSEDRKYLIFSLFSSQSEVNSKKYFFEDSNYILFYSGLPIDVSQKISAHNAEDLLNYFEDKKYDLEGQASIIRFNKLNYNTDIITDLLGMEQVYYYHNQDQLIVSNNIKLIETTTNCNEVDLIGAAYYLTIGWVADKYTLRKHIHLIRGGRHWKWDSCKKTIIEKIYFDPSLIKINSKNVLNKREIKVLYKNMQNYLVLLEKYFDLECPLTGGYDSRLVAALLIDKNIKSKYYTAGNPEHPDVKIASLIASEFSLPHRVYTIDYDYLLNNWEIIVKNYILQNYGMSSLWQIFNVLTHTESSGNFSVRLSTHGAEASRITYNRSFLWDNKIKLDDVYNYLTKTILVNKNEILNQTSVDIFYKYIESFFRTLTEKGIDHRLIPDLFYIYERTGRHHANHRGINKYKADIFSLFCSRTYLKTALQVHPTDKTSYPIHYKILKEINQQLIKMPNSHGKWPYQNKIIKLVRSNLIPIIKNNLLDLGLKNIVVKNNNKQNNVVIYNREIVFKKILNDVRSICLDQTNSELWQLIQRDKLENILNGKSKIERNALPQLYIIATLFYYEYLNK